MDLNELSRVLSEMSFRERRGAIKLAEVLVRRLMLMLRPTTLNARWERDPIFARPSSKQAKEAMADLVLQLLSVTENESSSQCTSKTGKN